MRFTLPDSRGWSALHLTNAEWGHIALIAKREWRLSGGAVLEDDPEEGIILADAVSVHEIDGEDTLVIGREAETALFKTHTDVLYIGRGTEARDPDGKQITSAKLTVNGVTRRSYARSGGQAKDPVNLFGYEPRNRRVPGGYDPDSFSLSVHGGALFWAARRSLGYLVHAASGALSGVLDVRVGTRNDDMTASDPDHLVASFRVNIPKISATPFVWEGGANKPAYWCRRAPIVMTADTLAITENRISVIWRAALPLASYPAADLRRIDLKEAA